MAIPTAAFLIPGDLNTRTGGYTYDRRVIECLSELGTPVQHIALDPTWPEPSVQAVAALRAELGRLPPGMAAMLDGLVFGAMPQDILAQQARPIIALVHHALGLEAGLDPSRAEFLLAQEKSNLRFADQVIVTSPHTLTYLVESFGVSPERITVAVPGFDRPDVPATVTKPVQPLILSVGTICTRKGHDILLKALAQIQHLPWRCVIAGMVLDHSLFESLLAQRDSAGLTERVEFAGAVSPEDLGTLYRQAHIFALATRYEGYGMVLSEAQLYHLPIVSCAVGAVPQTVPADTAILTPPDDPKAFAQALARLLTDQAEHRHFSEASQRHAQTLPSWEDTAKIVRQVLHKAGSQHAA